ncbi:MAG: hypothetical protein F4Y41_21150 [Gammaproteobacteria bacterium]|nr:hypothetical protein [Gammaproteobacteria bacterium]
MQELMYHAERRLGLAIVSKEMGHPQAERFRVLLDLSGGAVACRHPAALCTSQSPFAPDRGNPYLVATDAPWPLGGADRTSSTPTTVSA